MVFYDQDGQGTLFFAVYHLLLSRPVKLPLLPGKWLYGFATACLVKSMSENNAAEEQQNIYQIGFSRIPILHCPSGDIGVIRRSLIISDNILAISDCQYQVTNFGLAEGCGLLCDF
jgi:hypothetical protein